MPQTELGLGCSHCWHRRRGPIAMVVRDGHIVLECCKCHAIKTEHIDHIAIEIMYAD